MIRWNSTIKKEEENPQVDLFLQEIAEVCKKHGFSLSHADGQGSFIVQEYSEDSIEWLMGASIEVTPEETSSMTALEALNQSIEFWMVIAETGKTKHQVIQEFPERFGFIADYSSTCPCCEYTAWRIAPRTGLTRKECINYCPASRELNNCRGKSPYMAWVYLQDSAATKEDLTEAASKVLDALKAAKTRLERERQRLPA